MYLLYEIRKTISFYFAAIDIGDDIYVDSKIFEEEKEKS